MANSSINLTSLDFDALKSNLKTYLKSQSIFKDYDFEGANMNVLLDVLSYNTYLNSFYLNMVASELFLDSAQIRDSVVSHAKSINYIPDSAKSAKGLVNISFTTTGISDTFEIPAGTQFSGRNANGSFVFTTDKNITSTSTTNVFNFANVEIFEGTYISESYVVDYTKENQKFILTNPSIDTDSITVTVIENNAANTSIFAKADNLYNLNNQSNAYFLQAATAGKYEIVFGDNVFGRYPLDNSIVNVTYRITRGTAGAGVNTFYLDKDLGAYNGGIASFTITTVSPSSDGAEAEGIESIRFRAPKMYQTQDRAVTVSDYKTLIFKNFQEVKDVNVFGGEDIPNSVAYGKVFISASTYSGAPLTSQRKNDILYFIEDKKIVNIKPSIIDPEYIYLVPTVDVYADFSSTSYSVAEIRSLVLNNITNFNNTYLELFNNAFRLSKFVASINSVDASIASNQTKVQIYKTTSPLLNTPQPLSYSFNNELMPGSLYSSNFILGDGSTYQFTDYNPNNNTFTKTNDNTKYSVTNSKPIIYLRQITTSQTENYTQVGVVDYTTGIINIQNLTILDFLNNNGIKMFATTVSDDVYGKLNDIVLFDIGSATVNVYPV